MADDLDQYVLGGGSAPKGPAPVTSGAGVDELEKYVGGGVQAPAQTGPDLDSYVTGASAPEKTYSALFTDGVARNWAQVRATVPSLKAIYRESQGDLQGAVESAREAQEIMAPHGESEWNLQKIHSPIDFTYWLTEKLGEQAVTMLSMAGTGGLGGLSANLLARQLLNKQLLGHASARALTLAGTAVPTYGLTTALETAGTSQEQFEVTGSTQPGMSTAAGMAKGLLELYAPMSVAKRLIYPGASIGKSIPGGIAKLAFSEGITEASQEAIDIYARKISDPNYSYFKSGPTLMPEGWGEGMWRLMESGAAGATVGGVYGAPFVRPGDPRGSQQVGESQTFGPGEGPSGGPPLTVDRNLSLRLLPSANKVASESAFAKTVQQPGPAANTREVTGAEIEYRRQKLQEEDAATEAQRKLENDAIVRELDAQRKRAEFEIIPGGKGPITVLRNLAFRPNLLDRNLEQSNSKDPYSDALSIGAMVKDLELSEAAQDRYLDLYEANTPRWIELGGDPTRIFTDTEIEQEVALNRPQSYKPKWVRVNQGMLQLGAITAHVADLPPPGDPRIYFLPQTTAQDKAAALDIYSKLYPLTEEGNQLALGTAEAVQIRDAMRENYDFVLKKGLRVIPTRGSGFYYNGALDLTGQPVEDVKETSRSRGLGWYNPSTGFVTTIFRQDQANSAMSRNDILVSIDMNKVRPGDIEATDNGFVIKRPIEDLPGMVVPGVGIAPQEVDLVQKMQERGVDFTFSKHKTGAEVVAFNQDNPWNKKVTEIVKGYVPGINAVLKAIGLDQPITIAVSEFPGHPSEESAGFAALDLGVIAINPPSMQKWIMETGGDPANTIRTVLMHELGHIVTWHYFRQLPVDIQEGLFYAHRKAKLAGRLNSFGKSGDPGSNSPTQQWYWLTFSEWLAEQFRRWSGSNALPVTEFERTYKEGARKWEQYFREWEKRVDKNTLINITEPDYYFSAFMEYLRGYSKQKSAQKLFAEKYSIWTVPQDILDSPVLTGLANIISAALEPLLQILPPGVQVRLKQGLSPGLLADELLEAGAASFTMPEGKNAGFIELALMAIDSKDLEGEARTYFVHEGWHAVEKMGFVSPEEIAILDKDIQGRESELLPLQAKALYRQQILDLAAEAGITDRVAIEAAVELHWKQELRSYYVQQFANKDIAYSAEARGIMARILEWIERIGNALQGLGFKSRDDILRSFFKGEMASRSERAQETYDNTGFLSESHMAALDQELAANWFPDRWFQEGNYRAGVKYSDKERSAVAYHWHDEQGELRGVLHLEKRGPKGYEITWVESSALGLAPQMIQAAEKDLGIVAKYAGMFTEEGFKQAQILSRFRKEQDVLKLYQPIVLFGKTFWVSPKHLKQQIEYWAQALQNPQHPERVKGAQVQNIILLINNYRLMLKKLPADVWNDPRLEKMFSLRRNFGRDEVQGSMIREGMQADENELLEVIGVGARGPKQDAYEREFTLKQKLSQGRQARESGLPFDLSSPKTMMSFNLRKMMDWAGRHGNDPRMDQHLGGHLPHEADRMGWFSKIFLSIQQLAYKNEHVPGLVGYVDNLERMNALANTWLRRADETAKQWDRGPSAKDREAIADALFYLSDQKYRNNVQVANGSNRVPDSPALWQAWLAGGPPGPELASIFTKFKVKMKWQNLIRQVQNDFLDFLKDSEMYLDLNLQRTFQNNPTGYQQAKAKLSLDFATMREKPYFPMVRFGEFILRVHDGATGKIKWVSAYGTQRERDAAFWNVRRKYPGDNITVTRVPLETAEFMSLPGPLLQAIKENMLEKKQGMTPEQLKLIDDQLVWLEHYELLNSPDQTFRKRWLPARGLPGHSTDAFRAYAHYFTSGSRYLARLAYMGNLKVNINSVVNQAMDGSLGNSAKRMAMAEYMRKHYDYIMEGGRDSGKFRSLVAIWLLGFSPAAAFMNLTQPLVATWPHLSSIFGSAQAFSQLSQGLSAIKATYGIAVGSPTFNKAREEAQRQGFIEIGQAPEIAAYAEGNNLLKMKAGSSISRFWQGMQYYGMKMFAVTEHFNRELTFKAAWDLALKYPNVKRLQEIDRLKLTQADDLVTRLGFTHQEALAFLLAKEVVQRTQGTYDKTSDPAFMRNKAKDVLIFFKYMQIMLNLFGSHPVRMGLIFMFLYGLKGLPGSEDWNEVLRLVSRKLFGKDFDLHKEARTFVRDVTRGTIFDEVGPDLMLHGISRFGFGLGMLPTGWGAPRFDASANGSMGKIIPGFAEVMHGVNTGRDTGDIVADAAQRASGPGYGLFFQLFHAMMDPGSADSKTWQNLMQREWKALAKSYRYAVNPGAETNRQGAKIVPFDVTDPDDISTILAQAFGFTPTKVSQTWEMLRDVQDAIQVYKGRRSALYVQFDRALLEKDSGAIESVLQAIRKYNEEVIKIDPTQAIKPQQLQTSLKERQRQRSMMESTLAKNKGEFAVGERIKDLYPGVPGPRIERVR